MLEISEQYRKKVFSHIEEIKKSRRPVVIFGAGRAGWYISKVLEYFNVPVAAFSDNDPGKQHLYYNHRVHSPKNIAEEYPHARLLLGVFMPDTACVLEKQLQEMQFQDVHYDMAAFLFMYFVVVAGRICDQKILAESIDVLFHNYKEGAIHYGYNKDGYFVSPFVTSVITQKCSLRCRDCAQLIPYYKTPVHFSVESIINDLKQYAKAFDVVPEISLHGGEPFLHPDLQEICREAADIPNIVFISFVTNGTVMLPDDTLKEMSACGADVHQSGGYGSLSRKQDALFEAFRRHNIYSDIMFCSPTEKWIQPAATRKHSRSFPANNELYRRCVSSKTCCQIMDGELHRCTLSMHGMHQGLLPKFEGDFVRLREGPMADRDLNGKIRDFLVRDQALEVCDYCDPDGDTLVAPAIQLPRA